MKPFFLAVCYHYIGAKDRYPYPGISGITPGELETHLDEFSRHFDFVGIPEIVGRLREESPFPSRAVAITFDDGLREHYEQALPILEKKKIPFIFFVNSAPLQEKKVLSTHKIHYLRSLIAPDAFLKKVEKNAFDLFGISLPYSNIESQIPTGFYPYDNAESRLQKYILNFYLSPEHSRIIVDCIFAEYGIESEFCRTFYMSEQQLIEVHHRYNGLGLHGHRHLSLGELSDDEAREEIFLCKEIIENIVSDRVLCISYPFGYDTSVTYREEELAREAGLKFGFTMEMCFNRDITLAPHLLGRINYNECPGNKHAAFDYVDGTFVITDRKRMKYQRTNYYED